MIDKSSFHYKEPKALLFMGTRTIAEVLNKRQLEFSDIALRASAECNYVVYLQKKAHPSFKYDRFLVLKIAAPTRSILKKAFELPAEERNTSVIFTFSEYARCPVSWTYGFGGDAESDISVVSLKQLELEESYFVFKPWLSSYKFKEPVSVAERNFDKACDALVEILRGRCASRPAEPEWLMSKRGITPLSIPERLSLFQEAAASTYVIGQVGRWAVEQDTHGDLILSPIRDL